MISTVSLMLYVKQALILTSVIAEFSGKVHRGDINHPRLPGDIPENENANLEGIPSVNVKFHYPSVDPLETIALSTLVADIKRNQQRLTKIYSSLESFNEARSDWCIRDYSHACPDEWLDIGDGNCHAPNEYNGPCSTIVNYAENKEKTARLCGADWPCKNSCKEDFNSTCPANWVLNKVGNCVAPKNYEGPCITTVDFSEHSRVLKKKWSKLCEVNWPCV